MTASRQHLTRMHAQLTEMGIRTRTEKLATVGEILGREVTTTRDLTTQDVNAVVHALAERRTVIV